MGVGSRGGKAGQEGSVRENYNGNVKLKNKIKKDLCPCFIVEGGRERERD